MTPLLAVLVNEPHSVGVATISSIRGWVGLVKRPLDTPAHVRGFYREKLDSGLSAATVRKMHSVLRKALKQAVMDGLIPRNVCEAVKPLLKRADLPNICFHES
jgi:hypothetical protein